MMLIKEKIAECIDIKQRILCNDILLEKIQKVVEKITECFWGGGKVVLCGNGGSASDALHIAGEFMGRFQRERKSLPAIALPADVATLTSIANDYDFDSVYEREIEGLLRKGDVLIGISTSGNSENIYRAISKANSLGGNTIAFLGKSGGKIKTISNFSILVPSDCTARIQECHIMIAHIICEIVEDRFA